MGCYLISVIVCVECLTAETGLGIQKQQADIINSSQHQQQQQQIEFIEMKHTKLINPCCQRVADINRTFSLYLAFCKQNINYRLIEKVLYVCMCYTPSSCLLKAFKTFAFQCKFTFFFIAFVVVGFGLLFVLEMCVCVFFSHTDLLRW